MNLLDRLPSPAREALLAGTFVALAAGTVLPGWAGWAPLPVHLSQTALALTVVAAWGWATRSLAVAPGALPVADESDRAVLVAPHAATSGLGWADRLAARDPSFSLPALLAALRKLAGEGTWAVPRVEDVEVPEQGEVVVRAVVRGVDGAVRLVASGPSLAALARVSAEPCEPPREAIEPHPAAAAHRRALLQRETAFDADDFTTLAHRITAAVDDGDRSVADELGRLDLDWWATRTLPASGEVVTWIDARVDGRDERVELRCGERVLSLRREAGRPEAPWLLWRLRSAVPIALVVVALLALADDAWARVGGGQSYSRGSGSSGGGGGGGDDGALLLLVFRLVVLYPEIGIPLALVVGGFFVYRALHDGGARKGPVVQRTLPTTVRRGAAAAAVPGLSRLRSEDQGFSATVLLDYVTLVHRRALEAVGNGRWDGLQPFVAEPAAKRLREHHAGVTSIDEVVTGGVKITKVERHRSVPGSQPGEGEEDHLFVRVETTRLEHRGTRADRVHAEEVLVFRRAAGAVSLAPEKAEALACPSCGAPIEVGPMGECRQCGTPITKGQLQWQLVFVDRRFHRPAEQPKFEWTQGGDESSVSVPTIEAADLQTQLAALKRRHPDLSLARFEERAGTAYRELQAAWSEGRWERARPFVTDRMFQTLRFWMDRYGRARLRNRLEDVELRRLRIVKIEVDQWHEAISVRLWGSMKDSVVDASGKVVGGNPDVARGFSEIWTFLRSAEAREAKTEALQCPSCGAPLDKVDETGICQYCDAKITTGRFDWVLARIDQPEAWEG